MITIELEKRAALVAEEWRASNQRSNQPAVERDHFWHALLLWIVCQAAPAVIAWCVS